MTMQIEAFAPREGGWSAVQAAARGAEAAGFDSFACPEIDNDPFMTLTAAALATDRIGLRTAIAVAFPRSPMVVAGAAMELHRNSGGRFSLGLGTQVKGHNERRFSVPWSKPASRLREYVEALRAIWRCWRTGKQLNYRGEHYQFTLMTPEFAHDVPAELPLIAVHTAAVRPAMMKLAGRIGDGVRLHGFATRKYLDEVALPQIEAGLAEAGRPRERFQIRGGGFIATGPDEAAALKMREWVRHRVAFYASTRTYAPVLEVHGWEDLNLKLHAMTRAGQWEQMPAEVPDEVLDAFCVTAPWDRLAPAVEARFGGISDSLELGLEGEEPAEAMAGIVQDLQRLETRFTGFAAP